MSAVAAPQRPRCFFRTWYSPDDKPYKVCEGALPRINDRILGCVFYLYKTTEDAQEGKQVGGTGFLVGVRLPDSRRGSLVTAVTNKHNIENGGRVIRITTDLPSKSSYPLETTTGEWIFHPDGHDLAVYPYEIDQGLAHYNYMDVPTIFVTEKIMKDKSIGTGDDVFMVGRFINHDGKQHNVPSARFGHITQMPGVPIEANGHEHEAFLVECRSISGFSGSPVFVHMLSNTARHANMVMMGTALGPWLLGVDFCHIRSQEAVWNSHGERFGYTEVNTGMAGVIPAWRLAEMFELPDFKTALERKLVEADKSGVSLD